MLVQIALKECRNIGASQTICLDYFKGRFHEEHSIHISPFKPIDDCEKFACGGCGVDISDPERLVCDGLWHFCNKCKKIGYNYDSIHKEHFTKVRGADLPLEDDYDSEENG